MTTSVLHTVDIRGESGLSRHRVHFNFNFLQHFAALAENENFNFFPHVQLDMMENGSFHGV